MGVYLKRKSRLEGAANATPDALRGGNGFVDERSALQEQRENHLAAGQVMDAGNQQDLVRKLLEGTCKARDLGAFEGARRAKL